ncbi:hypothetical protein N9L45_00720 [Planctomycetota bacterium]|nr:hypothetical protein [Planctomycetota bacterium]
MKTLLTVEATDQEFQCAVSDAQNHLASCADWSGTYGLYRPRREPRGVSSIRFQFDDLGPVADASSHLTLRFGANLFCIHLLLPSHIPTPGSLEGLAEVARIMGATPCVMRQGGHDHRVLGIPNEWGLLHLETGEAVDPPSMLQDDPGLFPDGELQYFAMEYVQWRLIRSGGGPPVFRNALADDHATLWYFDPKRIVDSRWELRWLVVRAVREPAPHASPPDDWEARAQRLAEANLAADYPGVDWQLFDRSGKNRAHLKRLFKQRGFRGDFVSVRFFHPDTQPPGAEPLPLHRNGLLDFEGQGKWFDDHPERPPATLAVPRTERQAEEGAK